MSAASYSVLCDLGLENFDRPRAGRAAAKAAFAEVRRLAELDDRVRSTLLRRPERLTVRIELTLDAPGPWEAFDHARAILRAAVHANGGSTSGWEELRPVVRHPPSPASRRRRPPADRPTEFSAFPTWADVSVAARRRAHHSTPLPPFAELASEPALIDLR